MFGRMILPRVGGAPAAWNTCVVFFQVALVGGYLYAHLAAQYLSRRLQIVFQGALFALAALSLPIAIGADWAPAVSTNPIGSVFCVLLERVGLPFFALAGAGPLLQRWYAANASSDRTYSLYSISNAGSLAALLAYPLALEPTLRLKQQSSLWTAGFVLFAVLIVVCGLVVNRGKANAATPAARLRPVLNAHGRLKWLALAFVPSTLMLSVTTFVSIDIAPIPLLWVLPLALYLITFVLAFARRPIVSDRLLGRVFLPVAVCLIALELAPSVLPIPITISLHFAAFFVIALTCHTTLASLRPEAEGLTEFYVWIGAGGALGGLFNVLLAPRLFLNVLEYPLAVAVAVALHADTQAWSRTWRSRAWEIAAVAMPGLLVALSVYLVQHAGTLLPDRLSVRYLAFFALPFVWSAALWRTPRRMGVALALVVLASSFAHVDSRIPEYVERTFFGEQRILTIGASRHLYNGTTNHGAQGLDSRMTCEPLTYYSRVGPLGQVFTALELSASAHVGIVGLGTATIAAYARPGQQWTFFEIDPAVARIARDPEYFTFLRDCAPDARIVLGDARLSLANVPDGALDLLVIDAFSSDTVPVHLLTSEAMQLYFRKLTAQGVLAVHISNRYLRLAEPIAGVSRHEGLFAFTGNDVVPDPAADDIPDIFYSRWAVVARRMADFRSLTAAGNWESLANTTGVVWTDDYSNVLSVVGWRASGLFRWLGGTFGL